MGASTASVQAAFGEALVIRPMIRAQLAGGCVVHDFLSLCAGESEAVPLVEKIPNENRSLNPAGLAFIRSLHRTLQERNPARDPNRARMLQRLCTHLEALPTFGEGRLELPAALRGPLGTAFAEDAARCDAGIFGAPVLVPALENALAEAVAEPGSGPAPEEIARLRDLSLTWLDMMRRMRQEMSKAPRPGPGRGRPPGGAPRGA